MADSVNMVPSGVKATGESLISSVQSLQDKLAFFSDELNTKLYGWDAPAKNFRIKEIQTQITTMIKNLENIKSYGTSAISIAEGVEKLDRHYSA